MRSSDSGKKQNFFWRHFNGIAMAAIVLIPTIYTTLFLGSMWDPYGNVDQLPVAVVNNDKSVDYEGKTLAVGDELVDKLNLIAPVLFDREPGMGFEPEGSYQQFNDVFAEMVAWHNAAGITGNGHFVISRPDVDLHRQRSEQYYHEYIRQQKSISGGNDTSYTPVQDNEWTPPSPGM